MHQYVFSPGTVLHDPPYWPESKASLSPTLWGQKNTTKRFICIKMILHTFIKVQKYIVVNDPFSNILPWSGLTNHSWKARGPEPIDSCHLFLSWPLCKVELQDVCLVSASWLCIPRKCALWPNVTFYSLAVFAPAEIVLMPSWWKACICGIERPKRLCP